MSLPSVGEHLEAMGVTDPEDATPEQLHEALRLSCHTDLRLGMEYLSRQAAECHEINRRVLRIEDPNSPLGKELTRLFAGDELRIIVKQEFKVEAGFYNCCSPVLVPSGGDLEMSPLEQIKLQNGEFASANC